MLLQLGGGELMCTGRPRLLNSAQPKNLALQQKHMLHSSHRPGSHAGFCYPLFCKRLVGIMVIILLYCIHRRRSRGIMGIYAMDAMSNHPNVFMIDAHYQKLC